MIKKQLKGLIFDIQRYSIHDGPGIRTLVFMKGCTLRCLWCCNPESQSFSQEMMYTFTKCIGCGRCIEVCSTGASEKKNLIEAKELCRDCGNCVKVCPSTARQMVGRYMSVDAVMDEVEKDVRFYRRSGGGVTITGGEPLMQEDFVEVLLKKCNESGINTAIETCGYSTTENLVQVIRYVDLVLYDIKHMNTEKHKVLTGVRNEVILQNAIKIAEMGKKMVIRVPVIPGYNDTKENIKDIAIFANQLNNVSEIHLMPYHRLGESKYASLGKKYKLSGVKALDKNSLLNQKKLIELYDLKVHISG